MTSSMWDSLDAEIDRDIGHIKLVESYKLRYHESAAQSQVRRVLVLACSCATRLPTLARTALS